MAAAEKTIREQMQKDGVSLMIAKEPCALIKKSAAAFTVTDACVNCKQCVKPGCPAIVNGKANPYIDAALCTGCGVCALNCKVHAIVKAEKE